MLHQIKEGSYIGLVLQRSKRLLVQLGGEAVEHASEDVVGLFGEDLQGAPDRGSISAVFELDDVLIGHKFRWVAGSDNRGGLITLDGRRGEDRRKDGEEDAQTHDDRSK